MVLDTIQNSVWYTIPTITFSKWYWCLSGAGSRLRSRSSPLTHAEIKQQSIEHQKKLRKKKQWKFQHHFQSHHAHAYIYIHCTIIWFIASSQSERGVALPAWQVSSLCPFQFSQCPTYQNGEYWPSFYLSLECCVSVSPYIGDTIHALCSGLKTCLLPTVILPYSYLSISVI